MKRNLESCTCFPDEDIGDLANFLKMRLHHECRSILCRQVLPSLNLQARQLPSGEKFRGKPTTLYYVLILCLTSVLQILLYFFTVISHSLYRLGYLIAGGSCSCDHVINFPIFIFCDAAAIFFIP